MRNIYVISDTHFGHKRVVELEQRPSGFEQIIIDRWNEIVKDEDLVIHLGDFSLGKYQEYSHTESLKAWRQQLNGHIILVRGNHDGEKPKFYVDRGFDLCVEKLTMVVLGRKVILTHVPIHPPIKQGILNIHGHMHGNGHRIKDLEGKPEEWFIPGKTHLDVSANCTGYKPLLLESAVEMMIQYNLKTLL